VPTTARLIEPHPPGDAVVRRRRIGRRDRRELQNDLMDIGATSLATAEANVQAKVHAARNVLAALRGDTGPWNLDAINSAVDGVVALRPQ
jgi:pyruvate kinase